MQIAVQEDMLPGRTLMQKFETARSLDIAGIEFWADGLAERVPEIAEGIEKTGVLAAAVNFGRLGTLLHPDMSERDRVVSEMRLAMGHAIDIGAEKVVFVPHYGDPLLPDLWPYKSTVQLEAEMLVAYLRKIFTDLAYAMGMTFYMLPVNRYESHFINQIEQAASIRRKINDHAHIKLAASLFHMLMEEQDVAQAIIDHAADIGYVYVADGSRRLPSEGAADFAGFAGALKTIGYDGWVTLECGEPGNNADDARQYASELPASLAFLKQVGLG